MRLAMIYALLDRSTTIARVHLQAALALWKYVAASADWIFGSSLGDPVADEILRALERTPGGLTQTEIRDHFNRNKSAETIKDALQILAGYDLIRKETEKTDGRAATRWFAKSVAPDTPTR